MFCIFLVSFEYIFSQGSCKQKQVIKYIGRDLIKNIDLYTLEDETKFYTDVHKAYHHDSSCTTLEVSGERNNDICCYMKIKYKNLISGEKYTHYGCIEQNSTLIQDDGIDGVIDSLEEGFTYGMRKDMNERENRNTDNYIDYVDKVKIHIPLTKIA